MIDAARQTDTQPSDEPIERAPLAWRPVSAVALAVTVLLLATADRYDYHRDELYFRMVSAHPQWGYVDQPPFTPLLIRLAIDLFGDTVWAIRVPFAFILGGVAFLLAYVAREVGGRAVAQTLAATATLTTFPLVAGHLTLTDGPDLIAWLLVILFIMRAVLRNRPRYFLGAGLVVGLALYNKQLIFLLLIVFGLSVLLVGPRRILLSRWLWAGVGIAVLVGLPNLLYQIFNHFPQLSMAGALRDHKGDDARVMMVPLQLVWLGPVYVPIWITGIVTLLRDRRLRPVRAFGVAYPLMVVLLLLLAGQPYYTLGLLCAVFAVGTVPTVRWLAKANWRGGLLLAGAVLNTATSIVFSLPVIPIGTVGDTPVPAINQGTADQIGWQRYVRQIADVYAALPEQDKPNTVLLAGNYGEAGSLDRYGKAYGLPRVYSGQNELFHFGPPPESATVAVYVTEGHPDRMGVFGSCVQKATLDNGYGVDNEEQTAHVFVCRDRNGSWAELWPKFQHFD